MEKVQGLAHENSPVVLRGFTDTPDHELIAQKAESVDASYLSISDFNPEEKAEDGDSQDSKSTTLSGWLPYDGPTEITEDQEAYHTKQCPVSSPAK